MSVRSPEKHPLAFSKRAALFEPPPAMLAKAWPWVRQAHARICLGHLPEETPTTDTELVESARLRKELLAAAEGALPHADSSSLVMPLAVDLSGWRYGDTEVPANWRTCFLMVSPKEEKDRVGYWSPKDHAVVLLLGGWIKPDSLAQFRFWQKHVRATLEHELVHMAQWLMRSLRVLPGTPGLPSRRRRPPKAYDEHGNLIGWSKLPAGETESWMEEHALRDIEFQPRLRDEIDAFRRLAPKVRRRNRRLFLRAWLLPLDKAKPAHPTRDWWEVATLATDHPFFELLYNDDRAKWRDAASKFIKSVEDLL
jgi:hypothetical protein